MPAKMEIISRLKSKTEYSENGCWLWTGYKGHNGYGQVGHEGKNHRVHRIAYQTLCEEIDDDELVLHKCDIRHCWNPDHLVSGSALQNTEDMMTKGRHRYGKNPGSKNGFSLLEEKDIPSIRADKRRLIDIAESYGVHFTTISDIRRGKSWRHVP